MSATVLTVLGIGIIVVTVRDVVHELFHPEDMGSISGWVMQGTWKAVRAAARIHRRALYQAGPLVLVMVALTWTVLIVAGWALVYLPRLPHGFVAAPGLPPAQAQGLGSAVYVSLASVTTLAASDLTPGTIGLRFATTVESLVGLIIITAWITWVLSIYPVIAERRAFVREVMLLHRLHADPAALLGRLPPEPAAGLLRSLAEQLLKVGTRLSQTRVTYYFQHEAREMALAWQLPWLLALARAGERGADAGVRHHAGLLRATIEQVTDDVGKQFLRIDSAPTDALIAAFARDHMLVDRG